MYCYLLRIQFRWSTHIKPLQMAFGRTTDILYLITLGLYLLTYWQMLALFNSNTLNVVGGLWKAARVSASVMPLFGLQNLSVWKKLEIS